MSRYTPLPQSKYSDLPPRWRWWHRVVNNLRGYWRRWLLALVAVIALVVGEQRLAAKNDIVQNSDTIRAVSDNEFAQAGAPPYRTGLFITRANSWAVYFTYDCTLGRHLPARLTLDVVRRPRGPASAAAGSGRVLYSGEIARTSPIYKNTFHERGPGRYAFVIDAPAGCRWYLAAPPVQALNGVTVSP